MGLQHSQPPGAGTGPVSSNAWGRALSPHQPTKRLRWSPVPTPSIAAPSPAPADVGMLIPMRGCSGVDLGPASLSLLPTDPHSEHLLQDRASPPGPWAGVAVGRIALAVKSHLEAPITSRSMLLLVRIRPHGGCWRAVLPAHISWSQPSPASPFRQPPGAWGQ